MRTTASCEFNRIMKTRQQKIGGKQPPKKIKIIANEEIENQKIKKEGAISVSTGMPRIYPDRNKVVTSYFLPHKLRAMISPSNHEEQ